jgi:23S rRNA (cytosine1962-C5)-methyltransferase
MRSLENIPGPSQKRLALHVKPAAERAIRQGHPWLFESSIRKQNREGKAGDLAVVFDHKDRFLAIGLYDPFSPLRLRILQHHDPAEINRSWYRDRLADAVKLRASLPTTQTNGYRLVHGENDGLPGLVIDRYDTNFVLKLDTAAWVNQLPTVLPALFEVVPAERLVLRLSRKVANRPEPLYGLHDGQVLLGLPLEGPVLFQENGLTFEADLIQGQKTGFFLDQRENRALVEALVAKREDLRRVLNVFAYSGGFSLYAARGGAQHITNVDASAPALDSAERNFLLNNDRGSIASARHKTVCDDAFQVLERLGEGGRHFDLVVVDPPSFAKRQSEVARALRAYRRLANLSLAVLRPGGVLVMASCSSRIQGEEFFGVIHQVIRASGRSIREIARTGHPLDHPVGFAEGAYLKCLFAEIG